jgi:hypothetical protein
MGSFFRNIFSSPEAPKTAVVEPSVPAVPKTEDAKDTQRFKRKRRGRAQTVIAGELEPTDVGKRTLLG